MNKILVGFTAGLLVGILFAPAKGAETRSEIARRGRDLKDKFNDLVDSISERMEEVEEKVDSFAESTKRKIKEAKTDVVS